MDTQKTNAGAQKLPTDTRRFRKSFARHSAIVRTKTPGWLIVFIGSLGALAAAIVLVEKVTHESLVVEIRLGALALTVLGSFVSALLHVLFQSIMSR